MRIAVVISRILLGLIFFGFGLSGFLPLHPTLPAGLAGEFANVFFKSHWVLFVDGVESIGGALLLANRFVPLGLVLLGAVIANILVFHITMAPSGLPIPLLVTVLWFVVALALRSHFAPLLTRTVVYETGPRRA